MLGALTSTPCPFRLWPQSDVRGTSLAQLHVQNQEVLFPQAPGERSVPPAPTVEAPWSLVEDTFSLLSLAVLSQS